MAALSRVDKYLYIFAAVARVENVLEAATSPSPIPLGASDGQRQP